jgi:hypothetical protein
LNTEYGEMKIDWAKVVRVRSTAPMRVKVPGAQKGLVTDFFVGKYEIRHVTELSQDGPIALSDVKGINIGHIRHDGTFTVGGNHTSGNTNTKAVNAIGRATLQAHRQRLYIEAKYNYGEANGGVTARNWSGQLKYDLVPSVGAHPSASNKALSTVRWLLRPEVRQCHPNHDGPRRPRHCLSHPLREL